MRSVTPAPRHHGHGCLLAGLLIVGVVALVAIVVLYYLALTIEL